MTKQKGECPPSNIKIHPTRPGSFYIPASEFLVCRIDGADRSHMAAAFNKPRSGTYHGEQFEAYVLGMGVSLKEYCKQYLGVEWPKCPISREEVGYKISGLGLVFSRFKNHCGTSKATNEAFRRACERFSRERRGEANPMAGRKPWNRGLTAAADPRLRSIAAKLRGKKSTMGARLQQSLRRQLSPKQARHVTPHSAEALIKMRVDTASRYGRGIYSPKSKIQKKIEALLAEWGIVYESEFLLGFFSIDIAIPELQVAIEADGDYFHCNPNKYPGGPQDAIQRKNWRRDRARDTYLGNRGWIVLRYWESEILAPGFAERLQSDLCRLGIV